MATRKKLTRPNTRTRAPQTEPVPAPTPFHFDDAQVERALLTGEQKGPLQDYFGDAAYEELRDLSREASTRSVRGGARVLLLPGIMGSKLGTARLGPDDVLWFDPISVAAGRLFDLKLNGGNAKIKPLGVILFAYLKMKLKLRIAGLDADFYAYDWRRNLADLGKELAERLRSEPSPVHLVAHSMGGLVARAALKAGAQSVAKLIMLGTPNYGSFCPVQVIRATYDVVRKVGAIDLRHDAEELASEVFNGFPSLYQMLPAADRFTALDLYDPASWPTSGPRPVAALLKAARDRDAILAGADERFYLIAGVNRSTVVAVARSNGEFTYTLSPDGDGTVPLTLARLHGIPDDQVYFAEEQHGSLCNNGAVEKAVRELIASGKTEALPRTRPASNRPARVVQESELRGDPYEGRRGNALGSAELREALFAVAAPPQPEPIAVAASAAAGAADTGSFQGLVIGRRRQARLDLRLALGSLTEVDSRAYVLGSFKNVAPSGAARAIDDRLGGAIAEFMARRMISSDVGEVFAIPAGRNALRADMILFAGLGSFDTFNRDVQQLVAENVMRMLVRTRVDEFATVLIGGSTGQSTGTVVENLLTGFFRGLRDADPQHRFRAITLCETDPGRFAEIKRELHRLSATSLFNEIEVTLDEMELPRPVERAFVRRGVEPVYLLFRTEAVENGKVAFRSSILSSGGRAAVITAAAERSKQELDALLGRLDTLLRRADAAAELDVLGAELTRLLIPDAVCTELRRSRDYHLVVAHDELSSRIPWEILRIEDWSPAAEAGLTRRYMADDLPLATWAEQRRNTGTLRVLMVVNPKEDLEGADREAERIRQIAGSNAAITLTELRHSAATRAALVAEIRSGSYDVLHYAGHAFFDKDNPQRSGLLMADTVLRSADLKGISNLPSLVFFNACESARVRGKRADQSPWDDGVQDVRSRIAKTFGVAETLLRAGVANFLGTYWPVGDEPAMQFAMRFYEDVMKGVSLGEALQHGRSAVRALPSRDWADYLFYGSPEFTLKQR